MNIDKPMFTSICKVIIKPKKANAKHKPKYKVKLTFIEEVEATNEQDAIILAYDGVVASGYNDVEVDEIEND